MSSKLWEAFFNATRRQDWAAARERLAELAQADPSNPQVYIKTGDVCQRTGDSANAVAAYHRAAGILAGEGFHQKALALYKIILRLAPYDQDAMDRSRLIVEELEAPRGAVAASAPATSETVETAVDTEEEQGLVGGAEIEQAPSDWLESTSLAAEPAESPRAEASSGGAVPSLFSGMTFEEYQAVLASLDLRSFDEGEKIVEEGDSGDSLYIIKSGKARVTAHLFGKTIDLAILGAGDVFGEVSFLTGRPRTADVTALGPLKAYEVTRAAIEEVLEDDPDVIARLQEFFEARVHDTIRKVK